MDQERFRKFSKSEQLGAIGAEIMRAKAWERKDREKYNFAVGRALQLLDASLDDSRWQEWLFVLLYLRDELAKYYVGQRRNIDTLYTAI